MGFNLIMPRKVFAKVQVMCDEYEEKFQEKIPTARLVNVLLCEALIQRDLIPYDFIKKQYGCYYPIEQGFTPKSREKFHRETVTPEERAKIIYAHERQLFVSVKEQWDIHEHEESWKQKWIKKAEEFKDIIPEAQEILRKAGIK